MTLLTAKVIDRDAEPIPTVGTLIVTTAELIVPAGRPFFTPSLI